jgi:hypothetical protein
MQVTHGSAHGQRSNSIKQRTGYALALNFGVHVEKSEASCGVDSSEAGNVIISARRRRLLRVFADERYSPLFPI